MFELLMGDCLELMKTIPDGSVEHTINMKQQSKAITQHKTA